jgi:two-component system, cell cycle sensor histidine kinase and response regulator CckA
MDGAQARDSNSTILLVEDEALMLRLLERFFTQHGYHVLSASDGEQAVEIYHHYKMRIAVVLLDVRLPKMTGDEVFRRIKEENPAVKVALASGFLEPELKTAMNLIGVKCFVNKPYELNGLLETVQNLIAEG